MTVVICPKVAPAQQAVINLVVSRSVVSRLIGNRPVHRWEVWLHVVWVQPKQGSPTFLSKKAVWDEFRRLRQASPDLIHILPPLTSDSIARAHNATNGSVYTLSLSPIGTVACDCMDYMRQRDTLGHARSACKHVYAYRRQAT